MEIKVKKIKARPKITHTLTILVEHGIITNVL